MNAIQIDTAKLAPLAPKPGAAGAQLEGDDDLEWQEFLALGLRSEGIEAGDTVAWQRAPVLLSY